VQGVGEKWLFSATSRGFGYGYEAVRIRVKDIQRRVKYTSNYRVNLSYNSY
jgi:hypothetical protein